MGRGIYGTYRTKRGIYLHYSFYDDGDRSRKYYVDVWKTKEAPRRGGVGGYRLVDEHRPVTKELAAVILERHGVEVYVG